MLKESLARRRERKRETIVKRCEQCDFANYLDPDTGAGRSRCAKCGHVLGEPATRATTEPEPLELTPQTPEDLTAANDALARAQRREIMRGRVQGPLCDRQELEIHIQAEQAKASQGKLF